MHELAQRNKVNNIEYRKIVRSFNNDFQTATNRFETISLFEIVSNYKFENYAVLGIAQMVRKIKDCKANIFFKCFKIKPFICQQNMPKYRGKRT